MTAWFVDELRSLVRVSGVVVLRSTGNNRRVEKPFSVSKSNKNIRMRLWTEGKDNLVAVSPNLWLESGKTLSVYAESTYGKLSITAWHAWQARLIPCKYAGRLHATS
jgi:hypothetical protein